MILRTAVRDVSANGPARKLKFRIYVHLPSINTMFQYRYA